MSTALVPSGIVYNRPKAASSVRGPFLLPIAVFSSTLCRFLSPVDDSGGQEYLYRARSRREVIKTILLGFSFLLLQRPKPDQLPRISPP
jgi:hypothetical protein